MDDMTPTDKLRALLDERGVEWNDGGEGLTIIPVQYGVPRAWTVNTWPSGKDMGDCLWVQNRHPLTPEQVIAATVGNDDTSRWHELFGTPERAARTLANNCHRDGCIACPALDADCNVGDYDKLLEWLRGDA
jgi:hypothetical protein